MLKEFYEGARRCVSWLLVLSVFVFCSVGCEPLRKKFTRKKKEKKEVESIPVLEPVEYPAKVTTPAETYKYHYSLWVVWNKELSNIMLDRDNTKRKVYLLDQAMLNLQALKVLVTDEKQQRLNEDLKVLQEIHDDLTAALSKRTLNRLTLDLTNVERRIRQEFRFDAIKDYLQP